MLNLSINSVTPGKRIFMFILGVASGLPYAVFTGTLVAWLADNGIDTKTIGVLSWAGLMYAFKFLWSPLVSANSLPNLLPFSKFGRLRQWMFYCQAAIVGCMFCLTLLTPQSSIPIIALLAVVATFASATQDIAVGAWRIKASESDEMLNSITTTEQFGYRLSGFIGGAVVLIYADSVSWDAAWVFVTITMSICLAALFFIPDVNDSSDEEKIDITLGAKLPGNRSLYVAPVLATWGVSLAILFGFMALLLLSDSTMSTRNFTLYVGPFIVAACVGAPVLSSILIIKKCPEVRNHTIPANGIMDRFYVMLIEPMIDLVLRLRYAAIIVLTLVLTYRFTDTIWGSFAYPFYLGAPETGGMAYTLSEVAVASKMFGVLMTIAGTIVAGFVMAAIGRLPSLIIGGVLAAATNLLYADLALGGAYIDQFIYFVGIDHLYPPINAAVNFLETTPILADSVTVDQKLGRLMTVIAGENLAVGFASVVYVVYLSSIVNKQYAAVQYALLVSLTMLLGVLGRGYLGELIQEQGYAFVFVVTALAGLVGVAASVAELIRTRYQKSEN